MTLPFRILIDARLFDVLNDRNLQLLVLAAYIERRGRMWSVLS